MTGTTEAQAVPVVTLFRKKPVAVPAHQWHRLGDHPDDRPGALVVREYRATDPSGDRDCEVCGGPREVHGWVGTLEGGHRVCPGDWIITGVRGERYPCKDSIFRETYEPAGSDPDTTPVTRGELAAASLAADRARETIAMLGDDLLRQRARAQQAEAELAKAVAGERERIAGLLDEASAAIMAKAVELVSEGDEANGLPKVQMAASVGLAASLVRGKVPQQVSDLLPPGVLPGSTA